MPKDCPLDTQFPAHLQVLRARADAALEATGFDALAIHSGRATYRFLDDREVPYVSNPHFRHWVPVLGATDSWVWYAPGAKPRLLFHRPADYWHAAPPLPAGPWTDSFELQVIESPDAARPLLPLAGKRVAYLGEFAEEHSGWGFAAANPAPLLSRLHYARAVKTGYELDCMRAASRRGVQAHRAAETAWRAGRSEFDTHLAYCAAADQSEAELPYGNIIAFDRHAAVLHYQHLDREPPARRHSFLIDAGAQERSYACDITRTYAAEGEPEFAALVAALEREQLALCDRVRPGVDYRDIHLAAHRGIAGVLRESGLISLDAEAAVATGLTGVFFPHGIGHLLGLQVHDVAGLAAGPEGGERPRPEGHPFLRLTRPLEPGFVVTIEPGIYFIEMLLERARASDHARHVDWTAVERLKPCGGIRIEDDVACTTGSPENLTRDAFAALA
jgi:Xaa-Pro dipeptidase